MTSPLRHLAVFAVVVAVPLVAAATAPAGARTLTAKTVPAGKWATRFCTTLADWQNGLNDLQTDLTSRLATIESGSALDSTAMARAKNALDDFVGDVIDATDDATSRLAAAGVPDTPNGKEISKSLVQGLQKSNDVFEAARSDVVDLQTSDPTQFAADTQAIADEIRSSSDEVATAFDDAKQLDASGKLSKAVKAQRACAFLKPSA